MNPESFHPFSGELEPLSGLGRPERRFALPGGGEEREFENAGYAVTEYLSEGRSHEGFVRLKQFFEAAQAELGDILPKSFFVEGEPSDGNTGKSFYVVQKYENPEFNQSAKGLEELNAREFSVEFVDKLLAIQQRITDFLEKHAAGTPSEFLPENPLDPKCFKEGVLYSSQTGEIKLSHFFEFNPETAKQAIGGTAKFEPAAPRLAALKLLGLASVAEKINWAIERSAAPEWLAGRDVHWSMNRDKLEREGKKAMALTFDDGPNRETERLLDILKAVGVKATFFLVGSKISGREHIVKRIIDEGHDVGVHEWGQEGASPKAGLKEYAKRFVGPRKDLGDVKRTAELIEATAGMRPTMGRVAGVHGTVDSLREFQAMNLQVIHGNPYDVVAIPPSKKLPADKLLKRALSDNGQGKIRIFHIGVMKDGGDALDRSEINFAEGEVYPPEETLKMIEKYISASRAQGYEFVKVKDYIK